MEFFPKITFKDLKPRIADAIKESCYSTDVRIYNIANEVQNIVTFSVEPGVEIAEGLSKIIDKIIKDSVALDCDEAVIAKGIMLGAFRASPLIRQEAHKTVRILIDEILKSILKYHGDVKQAIGGILASIVAIAKEFKLNLQEALIIAKEDIVTSASSAGFKFTDDIKEVLSNSNNSS